MVLKLNLKPIHPFLEKVYQKHSTFHNGDAGLDLFCPSDLTVPPKAISFKVSLGVKCAGFNGEDKPTGYYMYPRSSMGAKTPLRLSNSVGIIDGGYRGEIMAFVDNNSDKPFQMTAGERYFQICAGDLSPIVMQVVEELDQTSRGEGGFGSTGV